MTTLEPGYTEEQLKAWKAENPMDYIKGVEFILGSRDPKTTMEALYRIARLQVPKRLYKYFSLSTDNILNMKKLDTLAAQQVYMADVEELNDPYDGYGYICDRASIERALRSAGFDFDPAILDFASMLRIASFTSCAADSMPMWAHYAGNHEGYCVEYCLDGENANLTRDVFPVQYTDTRIDITEPVKRELLNQLTISKLSLFSGGNMKVDVQKLVFLAILLENVKQTSWAYENEYRLTIPTASSPSKFAGATPHAIYIGMNCDDGHKHTEDRKRLLSIGADLDIPVYEMSKAPLSTGFNLISNRIL